MARGDATRHNLRSSRRSLQSSAAYLRSSSALPTKRAVHPRLRKRSLGSNEVAHAPSPNRRKKRRTSPPKRRPSLKRWASQHPTAPVRTASFRPRVTPQTQRGCAARCERTQPRRSSTKGRRRSASTTGCRRSGSRYRNGRRGIRTPCCFARVSRPEVKAAQKAAHGLGGAGGEVGAQGGHGARGRWDGRFGRAWRGRGTRGNVGASRAAGAGLSGGRPGRPRVLPDANACSWPDGAASGGD
jgi:hypothetical protein